MIRLRKYLITTKDGFIPQVLERLIKNNYG